MRSRASTGRPKFSGNPSDPESPRSASRASEIFDSPDPDSVRKSLESGELGGSASGLPTGAEYERSLFGFESVWSSSPVWSLTSCGTVRVNLST